MRRLLNVTAAFAVLAAASLTASADHHAAPSCSKPAPKCCQPAPRCCQAKKSCGLFGLPKLELPKLQLPKLDLFGCSKKSSCAPAPKNCSGSHATHGEEVKAPKVEDAPPPPYEEKAPAPAPPKEDAKAEPAKKA